MKTVPSEPAPDHPAPDHPAPDHPAPDRSAPDQRAPRGHDHHTSAPSEAAPASRWSRRRFLAASGSAGAAAAGLAAIGYATYRPGQSLAGARLSPARPAGVQSFVSRPDLTPPAVRFGQAPAASDRSFFMAPGPGGGQAGLMIVDAQGELVWFSPGSSGPRVMDFRTQVYRGQTVLTWWEGTVTAAGYGRGQGVIADTSYRRLATVRAGHGLEADLHEFLLTPEGTAFITAYRTAPADLSALGGPARGFVLAGVAQEIDVATGRVLFEWDSLDHVPVTETRRQFSGGTQASPFDYFHINSIAPAPGGHVLISARHTWTVYQLSRATGRIAWRLGGVQSDFAMGPGTRFFWQHDARPRGDGLVSLFDDGASPAEEKQSRGLVLQVDTTAMRATVARQYVHPGPLLAGAMGNVQFLPDGRVFVGWGTEPYFSEFTGDGRLLVDGRLPAGNESYRAFADQWSARPATRPDVAAVSDPFGGMIVYASWNGATGVHSWQVLTGASPARLRPAALVPRDGFETGARIARAPYAAASALDENGAELARSAPITPQ